MVVEINKNLFNPDHKYHTDKIDIQLESYALFKDRETSEEKTNCETFLLSITSANGDYNTSWDYKIADEAIMMNVEPGQQLWTTYRITKPNNSNNKNGKNFHKNQKQVTREGDMLVTTNRNGIRKEIPIKKNQQNRQR